VTFARSILIAGFLVVVAAAVVVAGLQAIWLAAVLFCAWLLVVIAERKTRPRPRHETSPEESPRVPEPVAVDPEPEVAREPEPEPVPEPVSLAVAPPPPPPEPEPEPQPRVVVPLVRRDTTPREWNVWDLERIAADEDGRHPARDEERALLLMSLRQFASASGELPVDFDPLVRESFGDSLNVLQMQGLR
jgi:outer membrane biosynthesis protein TonB